jgi:hypothetical protein
MSAAALLEDLDAAGIRLHGADGRLRAEIPVGASLDPFRDRIAVGKPTLLRAVLQREIMNTVTCDPTNFDRERVDQWW